MDVKRRSLGWLALVAFVSACGIIDAQPLINKIVLLAPFEGRYREVGYEALYAARLAFADYADLSVDLLPLDDGGSAALAQERAAAIRRDPIVRGVLLLGPHSTTEAVQATLDPLPSIIVGYWDAEPQGETVILASQQLHEAVTWNGPLSDLVDVSGPIVGAERLSLPQVARLSDNLVDVTIVSSGQLPTPTFRQLYGGDDPFAPEPNLLATLTYDATAILLMSLHSGQPLATIEHDGINGLIRFEDGYWDATPVYRYRYSDDAQLVLID